MPKLWKKAGFICIVLAALTIVGYGQTSTKQRGRSANLQAASGYLGVGVQTLADNSGVEVKTVTEDAPAARAGIHVKDVILEINGQKVASSEDFTESIVGKSPGTKVTLTVRRNGVKQSIVATLGTRPPDLPMSSAPQSGMIPTPFGPMSPEDLQTMITGDAPRIGFTGEGLGSQLAGYFGVQEGVLVQTVYEKSPAERAGLKAGDVVIKVNGMPVANPHEISGIVRQTKKTVVFTVVRNKKEITLNLEIALAHSPFENDVVN